MKKNSLQNHQNGEITSQMTQYASNFGNHILIFLYLVILFQKNYLMNKKHKTQESPPKEFFYFLCKLHTPYIALIGEGSFIWDRAQWLDKHPPPKNKEGDTLNLLEISRLKSITKIQYIGGIENYWNVHYKTNHNLSNKNMN